MIAAIPVEWVAWYGAALSSLALILQLTNFRRDQTRIRVSAESDMRVAGDPVLEAEGPFIIITVANIGRRPIALRSLPGFELTRKGRRASGKNFIVVKGPWQPSSSPKEGESCKILCRQQDLERSLLRRAVVIDETGKKWYGKITWNPK